MASQIKKNRRKQLKNTYEANRTSVDVKTKDIKKLISKFQPFFI